MRADDPAEPAFTDPDFSDAAGVLREEWRREEEEYTRAAAQQWTHGRGLPDVARDLLHRGDTVAIDVGARTFTGVIVEVGDDFLQLQTPGGHVDVALRNSPVVLRVVERARKGGRRSAATALTFRARLLERETDAVEVAVGCPLLRDELRGALTVGRDFIAVQPPVNEPVYLPIAWVTWVARWVG